MVKSFAWVFHLFLTLGLHPFSTGCNGYPPGKPGTERTAQYPLTPEGIPGFAGKEADKQVF